jgi:hypothetical protein
MSFAPVLLATLIALPSVQETVPDEAEPGAPKITKREKQRWLPDAEEDVQIEAAGRSKVAPAVTLGLSIAAGIAGTVFLVRTMDALDRFDATVGNGLSESAGPNVDIPTINTEALRDQQREVLMNGIATTTLFSASIAGLITSTVLLLSD